MGFKYINPGIYPFDNSIVTRTTSSTYTNTGHGFSTNQTSSSTNLDLLTLDEYYEEIYGTFDLYVPTLTQSTAVNLYFNVTDGTLPTSYIRIYHVYNTSKKTRTTFLYSNSRVEGTSERILSASNVISLNSVNKIYFHLVNNALTKVYCNENLVLDRNDATRAAANSSVYCSFCYYNRIQISTFGNFFFSNIILSDSRITQNEKMIEVPISSTSTNMTEDSGVYSANTVGKYLLQAPDKNSLVASYRDHRVTGISTIAYPAYTDGSPATIVSRESDLQRDSTTLTSSTVAGALSSWRMNQSMSQIDSKKYGWEVVS